MIAGKRQPAVRRAAFGDDRRAERFGHRDQLGHRVALGHAAAGEDRRVLRAERAARPLVGSPPPAAARGVSGRLNRRHVWQAAACPTTSICTSIGSDRNTGPVGGVSAVCTARRTATGRSCTRCTSHAHLVHGRVDLDHLAPQDRLFEHQPAVLLAGGDQQRRPFAIGVVEHAHRVAQAARDVQVDDAQAARGHRVAVGHRHHGHFLQAEDVLKPPVADQRVVQRHLGRAGIAEDVPHAEAGEQVEEGLDAGRVP